MVLDLDGFTVNGEFKTRELGYATLATNESGVYHFDPQIYMKTLSHTDKSTAGYAAYQIHGMFVIPDFDEPTCKISILEKIVSMLYEIHKHPIRYVVGYKGGHIEKDLLEKLDIPCLNIEELGCPRYNQIGTSTFTDISENCDFHHHYRGQGFPHCARREAEVFREWLKKTYSHIDESNEVVSVINIPETQELYDYEYFSNDDVTCDDMFMFPPLRKRDVDGNLKPSQSF